MVWINSINGRFGAKGCIQFEVIAPQLPSHSPMFVFILSSSKFQSSSPFSRAAQQPLEALKKFFINHSSVMKQLLGWIWQGIISQNMMGFKSGWLVWCPYPNLTSTVLNVFQPQRKITPKLALVTFPGYLFLSSLSVSPLNWRVSCLCLSRGWIWLFFQDFALEQIHPRASPHGVQRRNQLISSLPPVWTLNFNPNKRVGSIRFSK